MLGENKPEVEGKEAEGRRDRETQMAGREGRLGGRRETEE